MFESSFSACQCCESCASHFSGHPSLGTLPRKGALSAYVLSGIWDVGDVEGVISASSAFATFALTSVPNAKPSNVS